MNKESIFNAAIEKASPEGRAKFLEEACAGDADLRAGVEALVERLRPPGQFIGDIARAILSQPSTPPHRRVAAGQTIGRYKLLEQIGEGGMGVVYMAEQREPVRRKVALKIIKPGMDTRAGGRPLRGRAAGPGPDGPPQHRQGARRRGDRLGPALFRHGTGERSPAHRVLRPEQPHHATSGWSCSSRFARPCSTPIRRGSSIAT